jgi:hypothetical protein
VIGYPEDISKVNVKSECQKLMSKLMSCSTFLEPQKYNKESECKSLRSLNLLTDMEGVLKEKDYIFDAYRISYLCIILFFSTLSIISHILSYFLSLLRRIPSFDVLHPPVNSY